MTHQDLFSSFLNLFIPCLGFVAESFGKGSCSYSSGVSELPTTVILEILLKLPIKSIILCKGVCKSWYNLISDPYFGNNYLANPPFTALALSQHRTVANPLDVESFCFIEIGRNGYFMRTPFNPKALDFQRTGILGIIGSCNGLLCLVQSPQLEHETDGNYVYNRDSIYNNQSVYVINPLLGEYVVLPGVESAENIRDVIYGFGPSTSTNVYKVLRIIIRYSFIGLGHEIIVDGEIFTLGVDKKWRSFEDSAIPCYLFPCGITLNGVLHWVGDDRSSGVIFAFDIVGEKGHRIPLPPLLGDEPGNIVLAVWDNQLCFTDNSNELQVDIWTMKQYGIVESWTRYIILKTWIPSSLQPYPLIPITTLNNGDLLMSRPYGQSLLSFNPKTRKIVKFRISDVEGTVSFLFGYIPSFFSHKKDFASGHQSRLID